MVPVLLAFGLALAALVSAPLFAVVAGYFVATVTYSVKLKRLALVDVLTLGMLYTARIVAGGMAIGADLSVWLLAFSLFIFFALASVKRQAELTEAATRGVRRETRRGYRVEDRAVVTQMAVASGYVATLVFALYVQEELATGRYAQPEVLWLICPLLLYWISRMVLVAGRGEMHDDPLVYALKAPASRNVIALIATVLVVAVLL
jgi:4-hydroxybenzoate polyprenyltransferase